MSDLSLSSWQTRSVHGRNQTPEPLPGGESNIPPVSVTNLRRAEPPPYHLWRLNIGPTLTYYLTPPYAFLRGTLPDDVLCRIAEYDTSYRDMNEVLTFAYVRDPYETPAPSQLMIASDWCVRERCHCGRVYSRRHDDLAHFHRCPSCSFSPESPRVHFLRMYKSPNVYTGSLEPQSSFGARVFDTSTNHRDWFGVSQKLISHLATNSNFGMSDAIVTKLEDVMLYIAALGTQTSRQGVIYVTLAYLKTHTNKSLWKTFGDYIQVMFDKTPQSGFDEESDDFLSSIRTLRTDWQSCIKGQFFSQISKLLGIAVLTGICAADKVTLKCKDFTLLEPDLLDRHKNAFDVMDAIFTTLGYFAENTYLCVKTRSLHPLLFGESFADKLTSDFQKCELWWGLVRNGNLESVGEATESDFLTLMMDVTTRLKALVKEAHGLEKALLERKILEIARMNNDFTTMKIGQQVRKAPFVLEIFGLSSQGKTTLGEQIVRALLTAAGLSTDKSRQAPVNALEEYMSSWLSNKIVMIIDDLGNERPETSSVNPTRLVINVANNQVFLANMADLSQKGKVLVQPDIVIINTNVKTMHAAAYSACPYSIQRRPDMVLVVNAKKEFQELSSEGMPQGLSPFKVSEHYKKLGITERPLIEDLWDITVEKAIAPAQMTSVASYEVVKHPRLKDSQGKPIPMKNMSLPTLIPIMVDKFLRHRSDQEALVASSRTDRKLEVCGIGGCRHIKGYCSLHKKHPQSALRDAAERSRALISEKIAGEIFGLASGIDIGSGAVMMAVARRFCWQFNWLKLVPSQWMECEWFKAVYQLAHYEDMKRMWIRRTALMWLGAGASMALAFRTKQPLVIAPVTFGASMVATCGTARMSSHVQDWFVEKMHRDNVIHEAARKWRDVHMAGVAKGCAVIAGAYACYKAWCAFRPIAPHSMMFPTPEDIAKRDAQEDVWCKVDQDVLPEVLDKTVQPNILKQVVVKNLFYVHLQDADDRCSRANALMLKSNMYVIPTHYIEEMKHPIRALFTKCGLERQVAGKSFRTIITEENTFSPEDGDLTYAHTPNGGSFRSLLNHVTDKPEANYPALGTYIDVEGKQIDMTARITSKRTTNNSELDGRRKHFDGGDYDYLSINTFRGMCGTPMISDRKGSRITGIHVGGITGTPHGCIHGFNITDMSNALTYFTGMYSTVVTPEIKECVTTHKGKSFMMQGPPNNKSPLMFMPIGSSIRFHGMCTGKVTPMSTVRTTLMSHSISEIFQVPNIWGGPTIRPSYWPYQKCLSNLCRPCDPFEPALVERSAEDYIRPLLQNVDNDWKSSPLTEEENLNGIPGKKFIDALVLKTSAGYPYTGKKRQFVEDVEAVGSRTLTIEARESVAQVENKLAACERSCMIAKACTKDEVLPSEKKKCRIFYACPFELVYLARKYYLPVLRFLQMHPALTECAVGANCFGTDWQDLIEFASSKGKVIAGDYSKYDQTLPAQLIATALNLLCRLGAEMGYTSREQAIMKNMIGDLIYPMINFNGDLISLTEGGWISGVPMTVHVNGICGSLLMRCAFFTMYPKVDEFRSCVALLTYGDDNFGSVTKECEDFNIKSISKYLEPYGMVYTMPDKDSELVEFLELSEVEFLKRQSSYIEEIDRSVGALREESIYKSLHCQIASKDNKTEKEACAELLEGALREWFCHGRKIFEDRHAKVRKVAHTHDLTHFMPTIDKGFDVRVDEWKRKYSPRSHMGDAHGREVEECDDQQDTAIEEYEQQFHIVGTDCQVHNAI